MVEIIGLVFLALCLASLILWLVVLTKISRGQPILERRPRRPVPWNFAAALPAVLFSLMAMGVMLQQSTVDRSAPTSDVAETMVEAAEGEQESPEAEVSELVDADDDAAKSASLLLLSNFVFTLGIGVAVVLVVVSTSKATSFDMGLPPTLGDLVDDIKLGLLTALAILAPVFILQAIAVQFISEYEHPLLDQMMENPDPLVLILAALTASVAAPLVEETFYRLLFQGWLEKWEDGKAGLLPSSETVSQDDTQHAIERDLLEQLALETADENPYAAPVAESLSQEQATAEQVASQWVEQPKWFFHGWVSITVSSLLFALAHLGQGPAPIALFVLAIILGYVYQRTHRIVPVIVAHAAFNSLSVAIMIVQITTGLK